MTTARCAGWVGGLGAFGGFVIPPVMAFAVSDLGQPGYSIGFIVFVFLALLSRSLTWMTKYATAPPDRSGVTRPGAIGCYRHRRLTVDSAA